MIIRKAKPKDILEVARLSYDSAIFHKRLTPYYDVDKNAQKILEESLAKNIKSSNGRIFVAEENDNIIGYLLAFKINREEMFKIKKAGLIADIFISEDFRKIGTGEGLVKECFNWFKENGISFVEISVEVSNSGALKFWDKMEFKDVCVLKYKKI